MHMNSSGVFRIRKHFLHVKGAVRGVSMRRVDDWEIVWVTAAKRSKDRIASAAPAPAPAPAK